MSDTNFKLLYDDGNIPRIDLPHSEDSVSLSDASVKQTNFFKAGTYSESTRSSAKVNAESLCSRKDCHGGE